MEMETSWVPLTLLLLFVFGGTLSEKACLCKDSIEIQRVTVYGNVIVPCPNFIEQEMIFKLFMGSYNIVKKWTTENQNNSDNISLNVNMENNRTSFVLSNVTKEQMGLYTCEAQKTFPPPIVKVTEEPQAIVIVDEPQHHSVEQSHLPWWVVLGVLTTYSSIITYTALALRSRLQKMDFRRHDYINMRPRVQRKKQGVLHPPQFSWYRDSTPSTAYCNKHPSNRPKHRV